MKRMLLVLLFSLTSLSLQASEAELNNTLVRIINQLNAVLPLLDEAHEEVEQGSRMQLHIEAFEGPDGKTHAGVRDDVLALRNALIDYINKPAIEPRTVKPLAFDFVGKQP